MNVASVGRSRVNLVVGVILGETSRESSDVEGGVNWPVNGTGSVVSEHDSRCEVYGSDVDRPDSGFLEVLTNSAVDETLRRMRSWRLCHRNAGSDR